MNAKVLKNWLFLFFAVLLSLNVLARGAGAIGTVPIEELPREARQTLSLIKNGGPYPFPKDGSVFRNYEQILPKQQRGYYREYTVKTPGVRNRGARRIVAGGNPVSSAEYYYTDDHYATFRRIKE